MSEPVAKSIAVVGGGMSGLVAARQLCQAGRNVTLFDKGRGIGGRMSVRHTENNSLTFDHGAQYFTAKSDSFAKQVAAWEQAGSVAEWSVRFRKITCDPSGAIMTSEEPIEAKRYVGTPGMNAPLKQLASDVQSLGGLIATKTRVASLKKIENRWRLATDHGEEIGDFDSVIVSAPAPQAAELITASPALANAAKSVKMSGCWALMLAFNSKLPTDFEAAWIEATSVRQPLAWVANNGSKPQRSTGSSEGSSWVLHSDPTWAAERFELDTTEVAKEMLAAFAKLIGTELPKTRYLAAHRWRYALPKPLSEAAIIDQERSLYACGDWCGGPRVEGAYLSGLAVADAVLEEN